MVDGEPFAIDHSRTFGDREPPVVDGSFATAWIDHDDSGTAKRLTNSFAEADLRRAAEAIDGLEALPEDQRPPKEQIKLLRQRLAYLQPEGPSKFDALRSHLPKFGRKSLPRDGDGDGLIYEGTPRERPVMARTGWPKLDLAIEDFLDEPVGGEGGDTPVRALSDSELSHGLCDEVTEQFVAFLKQRGFEQVYVTRTDLEEMGYEVTGGGGDVLDSEGSIVQGHYEEHTVASVYPEGARFPFYIDFTASQYGYSEHPKVTD